MASAAHRSTPLKYKKELFPVLAVLRKNRHPKNVHTDWWGSPPALRLHVFPRYTPVLHALRGLRDGTAEAVLQISHRALPQTAKKAPLQPATQAAHAFPRVQHQVGEGDESRATLPGGWRGRKGYALVSPTV